MRMRHHDIAYRLIGYVYSPDRGRSLSVSLDAGGAWSEVHVYSLVEGPMTATIEHQAHRVSVKLRQLFDAGAWMNEISKSAKVQFGTDMREIG